MEELIEVKESKNGIQTVSARLLHEKLEVKTLFRQWFPRMCEYGFIEGQDYKRVYQKCATLGGEQTVVDYELTMECAKEICMIQRSEIGKKFRQYFIACEKKLLEHKEIRDKSKKIRNNFTDTLANHGYTKQHEYIQTTNQMKKSLGITNKKEDMTDKELRLVTAAEYLADCLIDDEFGFHEVNPVCVDASTNVANFIEEKKQKKLSA